MEAGAVGMDVSVAPDPSLQSDCNKALLRRRAWAQSRDSQESKRERCDPQGPQQNQGGEDAQAPSEEQGRVPNKIASWLIDCRTPLGSSLDDQSASPSKGPLRNGCSFEDDLSLGAEANHLQSSNDKTESCFGLAADQKRSQYKERGRSMNSTGSGKSSTVSSVSEVLKQSEEQPEEILLTLRVSELLDLYEEDPEEILFNLGFGREEPDLASKIPSRFFNNTSSARGIDVKVFLGAQMQRLELENPNYALTSRFRQIEVLTNVANEFFQLYSQVSGQPVQRISREHADGGGAGEGGVESSPPLKRNNSALNVAKLIKKTLSKQNLLAAAPESPEAHTPAQHTQVNGHAPSDHTHTNGHVHSGPEQDAVVINPDHQGESVNPKLIRRKDLRSLATVTEETNGDGETDQPTDKSPEQSNTASAASDDQRQPQSADLQSTNQITEGGTQVVKDEKNMTSTPEKAPPSLTPPQLAQLRTENADSFDMEEIQSNDDDGLPFRTSRTTDLLRTVSQQSDSSGFAEEPSADSNSYLKVQESSDSCDSETTVTSHPSQDVATPLALDQPAFDIPDSKEVESGPGETAEADGSSSHPKEEDEHNESLVQIPQYTAHQLPRVSPVAEQQDETKDDKDQTDAKPEPELEPEPEVPHSISAAEQEPQHTENHTDTAADTDTPTEREEAQMELAPLDGSGSSCSSTPSSPVLSALNRAKQKQLSRGGLRVNPWPTETMLGRGRGRRGIPLQRSSSLPTSFLSPSRVVSSVRIQFGGGQASCTQPRYSFKYTQEATEGNEEEQTDNNKKEEDEEEEEEEEEGPTSCLSTLIINPGSKNQPSRPSTEMSLPPKPIPRHLMRSSYSLQSSSPPPDWSPGYNAQSWSTQSVPDLSSNQHPPGNFQQNINTNQPGWNSGQIFSYPNPSPSTSGQYFNPSPSPTPSLNPSPYPYTPLQQPSPLHPYASLPNLHHNHMLNHHSSLTNLHQSTTPTIPQHCSLSNLHQTSAPTPSHHISLGNLHHSGSPMTHHHQQGYNMQHGPYSHQTPYPAATPHGSLFASPHLGYHGYNTNPHLPFHHHASQYPLAAPDHGLHPGHMPPAPGFFSGLGQGHSLHPGLAAPAAPGPSYGPSSAEMQLRRVLHDIRGTVQSLSQNRADTPDSLSEHRPAPPNHQSLTEFQQKRRSLNLFRSQMMDLELSIMRQQALVYKHLSPADRLEMEQLQSLRTAVREELQELEQQLEDKMIELTQETQHRGLHRNNSVDSLSTTSALRAMEPMSDLLREQLLLQSELSYDGNAPSTNPSSRSSSPGRGGRGGREAERQGVYRASINITPAPPPRPNGNIKEEPEDEEGAREGGGEERCIEVQEEVGAAAAEGGGVRVDNLQQLIREIRESVAQEVRREIYSELLSAVSPRHSPLPTARHRQ